MRYVSLLSLLVLSSLSVFCYSQQEDLRSAESSSASIATWRKHIHHHRRHHRKGHHSKRRGHKAHKNSTEVRKNSTSNATIVINKTSANELNKTGTKPASASEKNLVDKMQKLEKELSAKAEHLENPKTHKIAVAPENHTATQTGKLEVNAPLPEDFEEMFAKATSEATGVSPKEVKLISTLPLAKAHGKVAVVRFTGPGDVVKAVLAQAADPESKLAMGPLCIYLVARDDEGGVNEQCGGGVISAMAQGQARARKPDKAAEEGESDEESREVEDKNIDIDTAMPYGQLEPFGREDTAQELTESSIKESDGMVDQLEKAEVAEEKRAIFRALTRLRGAAITSFDGIARSQTGNIDEYSKNNKWRESHPLRHLAQEESDISKWAFPDANL